MRRSEIFEAFVKIAEEKGLVSKSSPEENIADLSKSHRADSLSIDDISKLYGVKPPAPEDAQYKRNIIERAHPDPLVITPSYDKLNSLIENNNERQDILLHIVNKNNDGSIVQRKYAERELILSLVRVGNDMDNRGQDELRALADVCLRQSNPIKKQGQLQVIIPIIGAIVGGLYAKQHLRFHSDGFDADYEKAINELDDLLSSNSNFGVGYDYKPEFVGVVNDVKNKLSELNTAYKAVLPHLDKLEMPRTGPELLQMAKTTDSHEAIHALQEFKKVVAEVQPYLTKVVSDFSNEAYKDRQVAHKGFVSSIVDSSEILHGGTGLVADDFDDVVHALQTLLVDVNNVQKFLMEADSKARQDVAKLQASIGTATTEPETTSVPLPSVREVGGTPASPVEEVQTRTLEQELEENPDLEEFEG